MRSTENCKECNDREHCGQENDGIASCWRCGKGVGCIGLNNCRAINPFSKECYFERREL